MDGLLRDKTRPSRIPPLAPEAVERVVEVALIEPPAGFLIDGQIQLHKVRSAPTTLS